MMKTNYEPVADDSAMISKANKVFNWLINYMICRYTYVHEVLMTMHRVPTTKISTMGVKVESGELTLAYNPQWFSYLKTGEATYAFIHECFHVLLLHCTGRIPSVNHDLWNIALDLAVNELIEEAFPDICLIPRNEDGSIGVCLVAEFKKNALYSDIKPKQTAEWYFQYLRGKQKQIQVKPPKNGQGQGSGKDQNKDEGTGLPGIPKEFDSHDGFREDEVADERARQTVKDITSSDSWGSISAASKEAVFAAQVRKINWRTKIISWFGMIAMRDQCNTIKKPNRRMGWDFPGKKRLYMDKWLVAADTSGSIDADLLGKWLAIVNQIAESMPIDFMQFDCSVTQLPKPWTNRKPKLDFKGRGGTSFDPVVDICDKGRYAGVMILTDGVASAPRKPRRAKVLWCVPNKAYHPPVEWGDRVYIEL